MDILSIKEEYKDNKTTNIIMELVLSEEENRLLLEKAVNDILKEFIEREKEKKSKWEFTP